jgi:hypothetical protein
MSQRNKSSNEEAAVPPHPTPKSTGWNLAALDPRFNRWRIRADANLRHQYPSEILKMPRIDSVRHPAGPALARISTNSGARPSSAGIE